MLFRSARGTNGTSAEQADNSADSAGAVYLFTRSDGTWAQQAYVKASNTSAQDFFGISVALSADGNTLAVGAIGESSAATGVNGNQADNSADSAGAVYLFTRSSATWTQQAYVKASNTGCSDGFGQTVVLNSDGNTLAVGAIGESSAATGVNSPMLDASAPGAGAVYLFSRSGTVWSQSPL